MKTMRGLLAFLIGLLLGGYAVVSKAGYMYEGVCYTTTANALQAFRGSLPKVDAGRTYYFSAVPTISATGLITATIASKAVTAATVTAGVANTYQLQTCIIDNPESLAGLAEKTLAQIASQVAATDSLLIATNNNTQVNQSLLDTVSGVVAAQGMTNARQYSLESLIIAVLGVALFFIGFNSGKGRH